MATNAPLSAVQGMAPTTTSPPPDPQQQTSQQPNGMPPSPPATPHPDLQRPPVPAGSLVMTQEQYNRFLSRDAELTEIEAEVERQEAEARQEEFRRQAGTDPQAAIDATRDWYEQRLQEQQARADRVESERLNERLTATLAQAIQGVGFAGASEEQRRYAAEDFVANISQHFEARRNPANGEIDIREKVSGRPAIEAIRERLTSPRYAHFLAPTSRGGSGTDGSRSFVLPEQPGQLSDFQKQQADFIRLRRSGGFNGQWPAFGLVPGQIPPTS